MAKRQLAAAFAVMAAMGLIYLGTLTTPEAVPAGSERITQNVTLAALDGVMLQMDVCDSAQSARISAARLTGRGSAGYVRTDDGYRVLGIWSQTQSEAENMQTTLAENGVPTELYVCNGQTLTLKVTADAAQIEALTAALHAVEMAAVQPGRIAAQMDSGTMTADRARGMMAMLLADVQAARTDFAGTEAAAPLGPALIQLLDETEKALVPLTKISPATDLMLAGEMRCAGMGVYFVREEMMERVGGQR